MGLVKHGKYVLARLTHDYKNKADQLVDIDPDEAQILGLTFEDNQDYESMYLTIEALEDGEFEIYKYSLVSSFNYDLYYSLDNGNNWQLYTSKFNVNIGDKILFKSNFGYTYGYWNGYSHQYDQYKFNPSFKYNLYGNILSLNYKDTFYSYNRYMPVYEENSGKYRYGYLFSNTKLISAKNLILPINTCWACYEGIFQNCTLLNEAPELSAIILSTRCYNNMFAGCTSLTKTPIIKGNINTNASGYYNGMFANCPNIIDITLLCTTTQSYGYNQIFDDNIKYSKGTFTKYEGVDLDSLIPVGWTVRELSQETGEVFNEYVKHLNN